MSERPRRPWFRFHLLTAVLMMVAASCSRCPSSNPCSRADSGDARVIEIAKDAVRANDTWADRATYEAERDGDGWSVIVWRIEGYGKDGQPQFVPGGHRFIRIDKNWNVVKYQRGE